MYQGISSWSDRPARQSRIGSRQAYVMSTVLAKPDGLLLLDIELISQSWKGQLVS